MARSTAGRTDPPRSNPTRRIVEVTLEGEPEKPPALRLVVLSRSGRLLGEARVKNGKAELNLADVALRSARVFVAPVGSGEADPVTLAGLERQRAFEAVVRSSQGAATIKLTPIPEIWWSLWTFCPCRVRGRVLKRLSLGSWSEERPVPLVRVHICEVDPLPRLIRRLPIPDLLRLRDALEDLLRRPPFPWPPFPEPDPWPIEPRFADSLPGPIREMARLSFDPQPEPPGVPIPWLNPQPDPPFTWLNPQPEPPRPTIDWNLINPQPEPPGLLHPGFSTSLTANSLTALRSTSPAVVREALIGHVDLIRPSLCLWPWFRKLLRCDEVAVVETDAQGRFETTLFYPCAGDHPDLYFWVEARLGGVWVTVHRPPMHCNTHWNYPCGTDLTLRIQDCRVQTAENPPASLTGTKVHVIRIGGVYVSQISSAGLTPGGAPFAEDLRPYVEFASTDLLEAGITHYRWSYRRLTLANGVTPFTDVWHELDAPVSHHYTEVKANGTWQIVPFPIGPDPAVSTTSLYRIRPEDPPIAASSLAGWWTTYGVDEAISGLFRSNAAEVPASETVLAADGTRRPAGLFELRLELFRLDGSGTPVAVTLPRDGFVIPPDPPSSGGVITPVVAPDSMVDRLDPADPASQVSAFLLRLRVDNYPCEAAIVPTTLNGAPADTCGMLSYTPPGPHTIRLAFTARHPQQFATCSFGVWRGSAGQIVAAGGGVEAAALSGTLRETVSPPLIHPLSFGRDATSTFSQTVLLSKLLGTCSSAAFAENLYVYATATNGYRRIHEFDRSATSAFAALA